MKRKVLSLALALVLTLGVGVPAYASITSLDVGVAITNVVTRQDGATSWDGINEAVLVVVSDGAVLTSTAEYELWYWPGRFTFEGDLLNDPVDVIYEGKRELTPFRKVAPGEEVVLSSNQPYVYVEPLKQVSYAWCIVVVDGATATSGTGNTPTATAAPSSSNYVATTPLNVRSGAGMSNDVIGGYKTGHPINVIEQVNRWWYKVQYTDSTVGYVSTLFVTGFDPAYYAAQNPDVVAALGSSYEALYGHYVRHGKGEGRAPYAGWTP